MVGALFGFVVSFASIWCMSRTSPTIYSLTGSLNKVVVALVGSTFLGVGVVGLPWHWRGLRPARSLAPAA